MKNYIARGESLTLIAPADGVLSGVPTLFGALIVVPKSSAKEGEPFTGLHKGVFKLDKPAADDAKQLEKAYWDKVAGVVTTKATGNILMGVFYNAAGKNETTANVLLTGNII